MLSENNGRAFVYQVLDDVLTCTSILPHARRTIFSVVDDLRASGAGVEELRRAEDVSIGLHKLEWSVQRGDDNEVERAREELKRIAVDLLNSRIRTKFI